METGKGRKKNFMDKLSRSLKYFELEKKRFARSMESWADKILFEMIEEKEVLVPQDFFDCTKVTFRPLQCIVNLQASYLFSSFVRPKYVRKLKNCISYIINLQTSYLCIYSAGPNKRVRYFWIFWTFPKFKKIYVFFCFSPM